MHTHWVDLATSASSPVRLRGALAARYPAFAPGALKEMVIIGAAAEGERICRLASGQSIRVLAVVDDDPMKQGRAMPGGASVRSALPEEIDRSIPVVIASHRALGATLRLQEEGRRNVLPSGVLGTIDPDRFPPHQFYRDWLEDIAANAERYRQLDRLLADDRSRWVLDAILGYRLSGDVRELAPVLDRNTFYPIDIFRLSETESYVDGGCFTGDTIHWFIERTGGRYDRIVGFEPDPENYRLLVRNLGGKPKIELRQLGLYRERRRLRFAGSLQRAGGISEDGELEVEVSSVDQELHAARVSFIKLNIEGAELDALQGARTTIARWQPKLCVAGYHKASHLWEVPLNMHELNPGYRIFLRQHDGGVIESTFYAVP